MRKYQRSSSKQSPAARITATIIEKLEQGTRPWVKPWRGVPVCRPLRSCGTPYRGMNTFWLWMMAEAAGYASPYWMTYRQCQALGGQVRQGEKSTIAIFYKTYDKEVEAADGGEDTETRRVLKSYAIFNADQCDDLPEMYRPRSLVEPVEPGGRELRLDGFFASIGAQLRHHGCEAYYEPSPDRITMPPASLFGGYDHYYATLAHELSHWTGHGSRLGRDLKNRFGSKAYAAEELVAELSAAILGAELGLPVAHLDHHASYIAHWLDLLKSDERAMLTAAAKAEEAAALILSLGEHETSMASDADDCFAEAACGRPAMGRSVSYPQNAIVAFRTIDIEHEDDWEWEYDCLVDEIAGTARKAFPSLELHEGWRGREDRILLRNAFADCGISTYCGLVAIWLTERDDSRYWEADYFHPRSDRSKRWLEQVAPRFRVLFSELRMIGRFSNGEAIFERIASVQLNA